MPRIQASCSTRRFYFFAQRHAYVAGWFGILSGMVYGTNPLEHYGTNSKAVAARRLRVRPQASREQADPD